MLRRFSIASRLFGLTGLVVLFCAATYLLLSGTIHRLEDVILTHTQKVMLDAHKSKIKALTHSMALTLGEGLKKIQDESRRREVIRAVVDPVRYEEDASGYYFVYTGTANVALPPRADLQGRDLKDLKDENGVYYVRELFRQAQAGGGYVFYTFSKPSGEEAPKLSYAEPVPGTPFWVGTGVYIDNVDKETASIARSIAELFNTGVAMSSGVFAVLVAVLCVVTLAIAHSVARPLEEATLAAERIASGDLETRLDVVGSDEAARLQNALNTMADTLRRDIQEIEARREEAENKAQLAEEALGEARRAGQEVVVQVARRIESLQKISSSVAHQLRNPTTIIGGLAGLLLKKPSLREHYLDYLDGIIDAARRIERITAAVNEYSSIRLGQTAAMPASTLFQDARRDAQSAAGDKPVDWILDDNGLTVHGDPELLAMALREVALNAVEALPAEGGHVRMRAVESSGGLELRVEDDGCGVAPEELAYVFDPFHSTKAVGVGMGLTKAQRAIQEHGGSVSIDSRQGLGTVVRLVLPVQAA